MLLGNEKNGCENAWLPQTAVHVKSMPRMGNILWGREEYNKTTIQ